MILYYLLMNILGFLLMGIDKYKAIHHQYRISEQTLFVLIWGGGMIGSGFGMFAFQHKIRKKLFTVSILLSLIVHVLILYYFYM